MKEEPEPPGDPPTSEETPFDRFTKFTRRILSVPKSELEEKERAYKEEGKHTRKPRPAS